MIYLYPPRKITSLLLYLLVILLPFFFFYWMIPFLSEWTIGNDYLAFPIKQQMELFFSINTGSFPLYVPGFGGGHSSSALTLGQLFHPLPHLASIMPGYWSGKAIEWNNFFKLLSLGFAHLALFGFLRKIRLSLFFSFLLSLITVYNLRVPDLYRYGAALEAYTAFLMLCAAIGWYFIKPTKWLGPLCMIGATYMLICSGHPQMMYFGVLGTLLFTLAIPFFISTIMPEKQINIKSIFKNWFVVGVCFSLGVILSSAYILPFYFDFLQVNIDRVGQNYAWADSNLDSFIGTLNNFFLPLHSDAFSSFGGSSLLLIAIVLPFLKCFRVKIPGSIWLIWGMVFFIFLYMQGSRTLVHELAWKYLPFASNFRVAGRISMIIPIFIMLLLVWIVNLEPQKQQMKPLSITSPRKLLVYICLLLMIIYYFLYITEFNISSLTEFHRNFTYPIGQFLDISYVWVSSILVILGIISFIAFAYYGKDSSLNRMFGIILIVASFMQIGIALKYRSAQWVEKKYDSPALNEMREEKKMMLDYLYYPGAGLHSSIVITQINQSFLEPFLGKIFAQVIPVKTIDESYIKMRNDRLPHQVFIEGYDQEKASVLSAGAKEMKEGSVKLTNSSFNRLKFLVASDTAAIFGLSYPYSGNWGAWVNGEKVHLYRANGAAHAIEIPSGESTVEFRYWSNTYFWGMLISFSTFALIGLFVCFFGLNGLPRIIGIPIILIISASGFMLWYNSLYNGDNLATEYVWTYSPPSEEQNLAYGKNSWVNEDAIPMKYSHTKREFRISSFVDGDKSPGSGFLSHPCNNPSWFLDLNEDRIIKTILLYESSDPLVNVRPLEISLSDDGNTWNTAATVISPATDAGATRIDFNSPMTARYIRISASGEGRLSFNEVEVY